MEDKRDNYTGRGKCRDELNITFPCSIDIGNYTKHKHINNEGASSIADKRERDSDDGN